MADSVSRDEFVRLEARVAVVEREVDGEKMVSRYILEQSRKNGDDLAVVMKRMDRLEGRFDKLEGKVDRLEAMLVGFARDLPGMIAQTMRDVLGERKP